ncbi:MAG: fumarate hydratase, partial [Syntrophorhabdus sp.]
MRSIHVNEIIETIKSLFIEANINLSDDVYNCIRAAIDKEDSPVGKEVLKELLKNADIARDERMPICQDTGLAVTFLEIGQDVHIEGGDLGDAIAEGVRRGY